MFVEGEKNRRVFLFIASDTAKLKIRHQKRERKKNKEQMTTTREVNDIEKLHMTGCPNDLPYLSIN